jgi:NAD(P)-dependent dehydrogenase (short-subunit alcohol dehydrogenase family)
MRDFYQPDLLTGRLAIVTGGATGIGLVGARALAQVGASVVMVSRNEERLGRAAEDLRTEGLRAQWKTLNVRDPDAVERVFGEIATEHSGIDILINNAGGQYVQPAEEVSPNGWQAVIDVNLNAVFYCASAAGRRMIAGGTGGCILNVIASFADRSSAGMVHSGAARAGVAHMTRTLAREWAEFGVRVNAIGPQLLTEAAIDAYQPAGVEYVARATPMGRWGTEEEIAGWFVALCAPFSGYVTGAIVPVDGGNAAGEGHSFRGGPFPDSPSAAISNGGKSA